MNLLNAKISIDLASSTRMISELKDHLRRMLRVFFHLAYNPDHFGGPESPSGGGNTPESDHEPESPVTPRSPSSSPRSPSVFASSASRRAPVFVPAAVLWDLLLEFSTLLRVPLEEVALMKQPLFQE